MGPSSITRAIQPLWSRSVMHSKLYCEDWGPASPSDRCSCSFLTGATPLPTRRGTHR